MLSSQLFCICFSAVLTVVPRRFSEDTGILAELVHVKVSPTSVGPKPATDYVRRAVWGMLHSDDACTVSRSPLGVAKITEVMEMICRAFVLTVSRVEDRDHVHASTAYTADDRDHVHAPIAYYDASRAAHTYKQVQSFTYLRATITKMPDMLTEIVRRTQRMLDAHHAVPRCDPRPAESGAIPQDPMVKAKAIEALVYDRGTSNRQESYSKLRTVHHRVLLRIIEAQRKRLDTIG